MEECHDEKATCFCSIRRSCPADWHARARFGLVHAGPRPFPPALKRGTLTTFDVPGTGSGSYQGTFLIAINTPGQIMGNYIDANGLSHGFVRARDGKIATFDAQVP